MNGIVKILSPREKADEMKLRIMVFRCKCNKIGKILKPPLSEIRLSFQKGMENVEFCARNHESGTLEFIYNDKETVLVDSA